MQEAGKTLDEIRRLPANRIALRPNPSIEAEQPVPERSIWRRLTLAPGVELQVAGNIRLPPPGRIQELAAWCRLHLISNNDPEGEADDV